ncbi:unnamed protein product, partial [Rotaria magnacalcarata]
QASQTVSVTREIQKLPTETVEIIEEPVQQVEIVKEFLVPQPPQVSRRKISLY